MFTILKQFTLFLGFCLTILLGLAIFGYFSFSFVLFAILISFFGFLLSLFYAFRNKKIIIDRFDVFVVIGILIFSLFLSFFHHGLPDGRDDASYMSAGIMLTKTGSLSFEDPLTHAYSGFRNLDGNIFTSQFLPGYSVYLAVYYMFGGINAMFWGNCLLIFLFFSLIYFFVKNVYSRKTALFSLLLLGTFYTTFWFTKRLNSENLFMVFFWLAILLFFDGLKNKKLTSLLFSLFSLLFCVFIRAEAIIFLGIALIVFLVILSSKKLRSFYLQKQQKPGASYLLFGGGIILVFILLGSYICEYNGISYFLKQFYDPWKLFSKVLIIALFLCLLLLLLNYVLKKYFSKFYFKAINYAKSNFQKIIFWFITINALGYELILFLYGENVFWSFYQIQFNFKVLGCYLVLFYLMIILLGLYKQLFKKEELILILLASPCFLFLFRAHISIDQPWFMRRFYPVFLPLIFILTSIVWFRLKELKFKSVKFVQLIIIILIIGNFLISLPIVFYRENYGIDKELKKFSQQFKDNDLLIMNPGWSWQKWAYSLHYLYSANVIPRREVFAKKEFLKEANNFDGQLNDDNVVVELKNYSDEKSFEVLKNLVKNYQNVYFLAAKDDLIGYPYRVDNLELAKDFNFSYKALSTNSLLAKYLKNPEIKNKKVADKIYDTPPLLPAETVLNLKLYKVLDKNNLYYAERKYDSKAINEFRDYLEDVLETNF